MSFAPVTLDGACEVQEDAGTLTIRTGGVRFGVRAVAGNGRPAAIISGTDRATIGETVTLDGSSSCDPEGGTLTYDWALVSVPAGSHWPISDVRSARAALTPDVTGVYKVGLRVTDLEGAPSDLAILTLEVESP